MPTNQSAYLCMCQALLDPWMAYKGTDFLQDQESQATRAVQLVIRPPLDANFLTSWPGASFIHS